MFSYPLPVSASADCPARLGGEQLKLYRRSHRQKFPVSHINLGRGSDLTVIYGVVGR